MVPPCREQVVNNSRLYSFPSNWEIDPETGFWECGRRAGARTDECTDYSTNDNVLYHSLSRAQNKCKEIVYYEADTHNLGKL